MRRTYKIHTTEESQVNYEANTELNKDLGMVAYSLWYRDTELGKEYPILHQSQQPTFLSQDVEYYNNSTANDLTEPFIEGVGQLTDDDSGGGWGGVDQELWNEMERVEQVIFSLLRDRIYKGDPSRESIMFLNWCEEKSQAE